MVELETKSILAVMCAPLTYIELKKGNRTEYRQEPMDLYHSIALFGEGNQELYFKEGIIEICAEQVIKLKV